LPASAFPLAALYQNKAECCDFVDAAPAFINRNIVVRNGRRPAGSIYAFNVFSRVENQEVCAGAKRNAPCVLTNLVAQEKALASILATVLQDNARSAAAGRPRIAAILIIAAGPLTSELCDDTATARLIAQLREAGAYTFVPAGNDGSSTQVRFPGCASAAVTVGALDRDGKISSFSNGQATSMVKLYTDGDTLVLPTRALPIRGLACMPSETFTRIALGYETVLARLGHYQGSPSGALDARASQAVLRFQKATRGLAQTQKFDAATLSALEGRAKRFRMAENAFHAVSANIKAAALPDLGAYRRYLCKADSRENYYQAQMVAGTLVSASIAAGQFLSLLDEHKSMSTKDIFESMMQVAAANRVKELNVGAVNAEIRTGKPPRSDAQ
jgi:hypothetical protein